MPDEIELIRQIKDGDRKALEALVVIHHRLVVCIAKRLQNNGLSLHELIIKGNSGLVIASCHFDERKGVKFISYAIWWIRHAIVQAIIENSNNQPLPLNTIGLIRQGTRLLNNNLVRYLKQEPTTEEIEGMYEFQITIMMDALRENSNQLSRLESLISGKS